LVAKGFDETYGICFFIFYLTFRSSCKTKYNWSYSISCH